MIKRVLNTKIKPIDLGKWLNKDWFIKDLAFSERMNINQPIEILRDQIKQKLNNCVTNSNNLTLNKC